MGKADSASNTKTMNGTIDLVKLLMAILVIGIHTEPFGFNYWLDKGFGISTRLCVPFFFVTSAYFYWRKKKSAILFLKRIALLYVIWSVIYLPFDLSTLGEMSILQLLNRFLWAGNEHALWYLCSTIIGFIITYFLLKFLNPKLVLIIAILFLIIGTIKSTYSTALQELFGVTLRDFLGSRNGLFYGFPYISLGMAIAKAETQGKTSNRIKLYIGFIVSTFMLIVESFVCVICFKAKATILWLAVFPCVFFFFEIVNNLNIQIKQNTSRTLRKMSTLIYVSQYLFIPVMSRLLSDFFLFIAVVISTVMFSMVIIKLSENKHLVFLRYLY